MILPDFLSKLTGAQAFANNPANGFKPTFGDGLQGIGHSMMEHYRRGQAPAASPAAPAGGGVGDVFGLLKGTPMANLGILGGILGQPGSAGPAGTPPFVPERRVIGRGAFAPVDQVAMPAFAPAAPTPPVQAPSMDLSAVARLFQ